MIRFLFALALIAGLVTCGAMVPLGEKTFFGHVSAIWKSDEAGALKKGVKERMDDPDLEEVARDVKDKAKPVAERVKRGAKAGWEAVTRDDAEDAGP